MKKILISIFALYYLLLPLGAGATLNTNSLALVAASTQHGYAADSASLSITGDISVEAWVKLSSVGIYNTIAAKYSAASVLSWWFYISSSNVLAFRYSHNGVENSLNRTDFTGSTTFTTGQWYHVAVTCDVSAQTATFYINGATETATIGSNWSTAIYDGNQNTDVGAGYDGAAYKFDGLIDEVRIWNDIRTSGEISGNYQTELTGSEAGLVAYYKLNNSALDETANNNDLTLVNAPSYSTDVPFAGSSDAPSGWDFYTD